MTNLEYYKYEIKEKYLKQGYLGDVVFQVAKKYGYKYDRSKKNDINLIDWLLSEYKEPIKLKKWEHDLIKIDFSLFKDHYFKASIICMELKKAGYFKGIKDTNMIVEEILNNCEVEDE